MLTVVLASPDAEGPTDLVAAIAGRIQAAGIATIVVRLDPKQADDTAHERRFRAALADLSGPVILGGFSLGARIAARLCANPCSGLAPIALLGLGYPFHAANQPDARHGLEALAAAGVPTLIIQGTRDSHGTQAQVQSYALPASVELVWLRDGNHRFVPRARSGLGHEQHIQAAATAAIAFIQGR